MLIWRRGTKSRRSWFNFQLQVLRISGLHMLCHGYRLHTRNIGTQRTKNGKIYINKRTHVQMVHHKLFYGSAGCLWRAGSTIVIINHYIHDSSTILDHPALLPLQLSIMIFTIYHYNYQLALLMLFTIALLFTIMNNQLFSGSAGTHHYQLNIPVPHDELLGTTFMGGCHLQGGPPWL